MRETRTFASRWAQPCRKSHNPNATDESSPELENLPRRQYLPRKIIASGFSGTFYTVDTSLLFRYCRLSVLFIVLKVKYIHYSINVAPHSPYGGRGAPFRFELKLFYFVPYSRCLLSDLLLDAAAVV